MRRVDAAALVPTLPCPHSLTLCLTLSDQLYPSDCDGCAGLVR